MLSFCSAVLTFVLLLALWLPQLQATLPPSKQKEVGKYVPDLSSPFISENQKLLRRPTVELHLAPICQS